MAKSTVLPSQMVSSDPALAVGTGSIVKVMLSLVFEQLPAPFAVRVSVTEPLAISLGPGV